MTPPINKKGNWQVKRNCCVSGNCFECRENGKFGRPVEVIQGSGYSEEYAKWVAGNWAGYKAYAEPMPKASS